MRNKLHITLDVFCAKIVTLMHLKSREICHFGEHFSFFFFFFDVIKL